MKKYHKWTKYISLKSKGLKAIHYKGVHYCAICNTIMPQYDEVRHIVLEGIEIEGVKYDYIETDFVFRMITYHHNQVLCNQCKLKWDDGNKRRGETPFDISKRYKKHLEYKKQKETTEETEWHDI